MRMTPEQEKWVCLCPLCYPNGKEYFELIEGCWLFQDNEGQWGLMCQPGHTDDEILMFPEKPWPDPDPECESKDESIIALNLKWVSVDLIGIKMIPEDGHFIVESCKKAGYAWKPPHRFLMQWLFDFAGKKLVEYESN